MVFHSDWSDDSRFAVLITHYINKCRRARFQGDLDLFNHYANLFTGRTDLKFTSKKEALHFSCTNEVERAVLRRYYKEYDSLIECILDAHNSTIGTSGKVVST